MIFFFFHILSSKKMSRRAMSTRCRARSPPIRAPTPPSPIDRSDQSEPIYETSDKNSVDTHDMHDMSVRECLSKDHSNDCLDFDVSPPATMKNQSPVVYEDIDSSSVIPTEMLRCLSERMMRTKRMLKIFR